MPSKRVPHMSLLRAVVDVVFSEELNAEKRNLWTSIQEFQKRVERHETLAQDLKEKEDALANKGMHAYMHITSRGLKQPCYSIQKKKRELRKSKRGHDCANGRNNSSRRWSASKRS